MGRRQRAPSHPGDRLRLVQTLVVLVACALGRVAATDSTLPSQPSIPCQTIADCWLASDGKAIARPKRYRGKPLPKPDCGNHILWLRNRLACDAGQCVAAFIGDRC